MDQFTAVASTNLIKVEDISKMKTKISTEDDFKSNVKEINNSHILLETINKIQIEKIDMKLSISLTLPVKHIGVQSSAA